MKFMQNLISLIAWLAIFYLLFASLRFWWGIKRNSDINMCWQPLTALALLSKIENCTKEIILFYYKYILFS